MKKALSTLLAGLLVLNAYAADPPVSKIVDLRSKNGANNYFIVFCARSNSLSGHGFVVTGVEDNTKQLSSVGAFGLYPVKDGDLFKSAFATVPGNIVDEYARDLENATGNMQAEMSRFILKVDEEEYNLVEISRKTWASRNDYKLLENDCVTFVMEVASRLGLTIPDRSEGIVPWKYLAKLADANNQGNFLNGRWESITPKKRFILEIKKNICTWIERSDAGTEISRPVVIVTIDKKYRIERPNDDAILIFLGFQSGLRAEILANNPEPSYLVLQRTGATLTGEWHGLLAKKDNNAHLSQLVQPSKMEGVLYTFKGLD